MPGFAAALKHFRRQHPGILLTLTELDSASQINAIAHSGIGILPRPPDPVIDLVQLTRYTTDPLVLATADDGPLARRGAIRVPDLARQPLVCTPRYSGLGLHQHLTRLCWHHGFVPDVVQESPA